MSETVTTPAPKPGVTAEDYRPIIDHWKADAAAARELLAAEKAKVTTAEGATQAAKDAAATALAEAQTATTRRLIQAELRVLAKDAGLVDADALKMADTSKLTMDDNGDVPGAAEFIKAFKEAKPWAFKASGVENGNTGGGKSPGETKGGAKMAKDMTDEEYRAARAELTRPRR